MTSATMAEAAKIAPVSRTRSDNAKHAPASAIDRFDSDQNAAITSPAASGSGRLVPMDSQKPGMNAMVSAESGQTPRDIAPTPTDASAMPPRMSATIVAGN